MTNEQKFIYLIFSHTSTRIGSVIRQVTHYFYNHVSISTSSDLSDICSFARYHKDSPFVGGFVHESSLRYCTNGVPSAIKVCAIPVSEKQYKKVCEYLSMVERDGEMYIYNLVSAAAFPFHKRIYIDRAFTCIEFAISVLCRCRLPRYLLIPRFCSIKKLDEIYSSYAIYEGEFPEGAGSPLELDDYNRKNGFKYRLNTTFSAGTRLILRLCKREKA